MSHTSAKGGVRSKSKQSVIFLTLLATVAGLAMIPPAAFCAGEQPPASSTNLHRADFKLAGASCVACVRRVGRTLRAQKGVVKADVSIFKPHWGIVIYDHSQTDMDKLYNVVRAQENVKFEELDDKKISSIPLIIVPKGMQNQAGSAAAHQDR